MAQFEIETYELQTSSYHSDHKHTIRLISPDLSHGIRNRVTLYFDSMPSYFSSDNIVGFASNVGDLNYDGLSIIAWFREHAFDEVYDILRSEAPIHFRYYLRNMPANPTGTTKFLTSALIATGAEPAGEGLADAQAAISHFRFLTQIGDVPSRASQTKAAEPA